MNSRIAGLGICVLLAGGSLATLTSQAVAQATVFDACYVAKTGVVYLINRPGLPTDCVKPDKHIQIRWVDALGADHTDLAGLGEDDHPQYLLSSGVRPSTGLTLTGGDGPIPFSGPGTRLMWYPGKGAFRAGSVETNEWDDILTGEHSVATGFGTVARGHTSTALGRYSQAFGETSTAMGLTAMATGDYSIAMGYQTEAAGEFSTALGRWTKATGQGSTALGDGTEATERVATAMGDRTHATGVASTAMGLATRASGHSSTAMGAQTEASGLYSTAMGLQTEATGDYSTAMGYGARTNGEMGAFVYGDFSYSSASVVAPAANSFTVRASGGTTFYSNPGMTTGVVLVPDDGAWSTVSDRSQKHDFRDEDGETALARIASIPIQSWRYKSQDESVRHIGPTAQDFHTAFGFGASNLMITTTDIDGVNMLAIQALEKRTRTLQAENDALRDRLAQVEAMLLSLVEIRK